jgi:hypothetical protein
MTYRVNGITTFWLNQVESSQDIETLVQAAAGSTDLRQMERPRLSTKSNAKWNDPDSRQNRLVYSRPLAENTFNHPKKKFHTNDPRLVTRQRTPWLRVTHHSQTMPFES